MRVWLSFVLMLALSACGAPAPHAPTPPQPVLLTVISSAGESPAPEAGLFGSYGLTGSATTFTAADLAALDQHTYATDYPLAGAVRQFEGPRLSDVLAAAGASGAGARLTALDGYQVELDADRITAHEPILAVTESGAPLAVGALGPVFLVWPRRDDPALADMQDDDWPWCVFAIEALEAGDAPG